MHCNMIACRRNRVVDFLSPGHNANSIALHEYPTLWAHQGRKDETFPPPPSPVAGPDEAPSLISVSFRRMGYLGIDQKSTLSIMYHAVPMKKTIRCLPTRLQHVEVSIASSACSRDPAPTKQIKEMRVKRGLTCRMLIKARVSN
jgi:hypothetical protein